MRSSVEGKEENVYENSNLAKSIEPNRIMQMLHARSQRYSVCSHTLKTQLSMHLFKSVILSVCV